MSETDMKVVSDTTLNLNWLRVNLPTIMTIGGLAYVLVVQNSEQNKQINQIEISRAERSKQADEKFNSITVGVETLKSKVSVLDNVVYRVGVVEGQIALTNQRIDKLSEDLLKSMETMKIELGVLSAEMRNLTNEIKNQKRASLTVPLSEPTGSIK